jgi:pyruvate/2-oxoglutarate dehydrogenase complex dihydrolipoamide acyltransferase (E2) component
MPHEVIMPALGMAQDTGQIVAWLKQPGEAVKTGDALMEVETDKATMEVEAAADGYLTDVRAKAGDSIPVGDVVAMISETADGAGDASAESRGAGEADGNDASPDHAPEEAAAIEGAEVIMPALGMSQDSGKIVAWLKSPGDEVGADDILFEVETDKAVTEVQAGHDGWLAETRAEEGDDVPVGEVIAVISAEKPDAPRSLSRAETGSSAGAAPAAKPEAAAEAAPAAKGAAQKPQPRKQQTTAPRPSGRVLASPKARRLAAERGLDLGRLVEAGYEPPFHVADLETLAALPEQSAGAAPAAAPATARVEAEVPAAVLAEFCAWAAEEKTPVAPSRAVAAFAAAALRQATAREGALHVALSRPGHGAVVHADLDRLPLGAEAEAADAAPDLVLRDLSASHLTRVSAESTVPTLTLCRRGETLALTLDFDATALDTEAAIALVADLAGRIEDPLRHLL